MEAALLFYSQAEESDLLNIVKQLINRYSETHKKFHLRKKINRRLTNSNTLRVIPNLILGDNSSSPTVKRASVETPQSRRASTRETPKSKASPYSIDQVLTLNNVFNKIAETYERTSWVRRPSTHCVEIHVALFKQVLFDCFLVDRKILELILEPASRTLWMGNDNFIKCLEEIHLGARWKFFSSKKIKKNENNNFHKQKLICKNYLVFFALLMIEKGGHLDRENLKRAINLAEKQNFFQLELLADFYFTKASDGKSESYNIPFENFYNVVINIDFSSL